MTRTSDRTLLQSLGFDDPDKREPEHDLGCRFMIQRPTMAKLAEVLGFWKGGWPARFSRESPAWSNREYPAWDDQRHGTYTGVSATASHQGHTEVPVQRESYSGQRNQGYHIGFLDAYVRLNCEFGAVWTRTRRPTDLEVVAVLGADPGGPRIGNVDPPMPPGCPDGENPYIWYKKARAELPDVEVTENVTRSFPLGQIGIEVKVQPTPVGNIIRQLKLYADYCQADRWVLATRYQITTSERDALRNESITHIRLASGFDAFIESERNAAQADSPEL